MPEARERLVRVLGEIWDAVVEEERASESWNKVALFKHTKTEWMARSTNSIGRWKRLSELLMDDKVYNQEQVAIFVSRIYEAIEKIGAAQEIVKSQPKGKRKGASKDARADAIATEKANLEEIRPGILALTTLGEKKSMSPASSLVVDTVFEAPPPESEKPKSAKKVDRKGKKEDKKVKKDDKKDKKTDKKEDKKAKKDDKKDKKGKDDKKAKKDESESSSLVSKPTLVIEKIEEPEEHHHHHHHHHHEPEASTKDLKPLVESIDLLSSVVKATAPKKSDSVISEEAVKSVAPPTRLESFKLHIENFNENVIRDNLDEVIAYAINEVLKQNVGETFYVTQNETLRAFLLSKSIDESLKNFNLYNSEEIARFRQNLLRVTRLPKDMRPRGIVDEFKKLALVRKDKDAGKFGCVMSLVGSYFENVFGALFNRDERQPENIRKAFGNDQNFKIAEALYPPLHVKSSEVGVMKPEPPTLKK